MNIQTPLLQAANRDAAASRPLTATPPGAAASDPAGFASLLRQTQAAPPPAQPAPQPRPAPSASASSTHPGAVATPAPAHEQAPDADRTDSAGTGTGSIDAADAADTSPTPAAQGRPRASAAGKPRPDAPTAAAQRAAKSATDDVAERETTPADKAGLELLPPLPPLPPLTPLPPLQTALSGPTAAPWPAGVQQALRGTALVDAGGHVAAANPAASLAADGLTSAWTGPGGAGSSPAAAPALQGADTAPVDQTRAEAAQQRTDKTSTDEAPADATTNGALFAPAPTEPRAVDEAPPLKAPPLFAATRNADVAAAIGATLANPSPGLSPAPAIAVALATPVTEPAFAQELGLRMSVLAQGGVQHAELHLNPAEMGPVSVQIVMDGSQARVDFGADVAATRAAIEAGLPALASALREAGFTLSGGGVSQHSRGRSDGRDGRDGRDGGSAAPRMRRVEGAALDAAAGAARHASRRKVSLGGLDLYA